MIRWFRAGVLVLVQVLLVFSALTVGAQIPARQVLYEARLYDAKDLFLLDVDRGVIHNLTHSSAEDSRPAWSPNGSQIVFESWRDGVRAVYIMDATGSNLRRLSADAGASEYDPRWSADGASVIFRSYRRAQGGETTMVMYQVNPDGSGLKLVDPASDYPVATSDHILSQRRVNGTWKLFVTQGNLTWELAEVPMLLRETPRWSFDRRLIAFIAPGYSGESEIFVMDSDGANQRQMTADGAPKSNLSWRPA